VLITGCATGAVTGGVVVVGVVCGTAVGTAVGAAAQPKPVLKIGVVADVSEHVALKPVNVEQPPSHASVQMSAVTVSPPHESLA
jgi:hypothetical protein